MCERAIACSLSPLRFVVFALVSAAVAAALNAYLYRRVHAAFALSRRSRRALLVLLVGMLAASVVGRALGRSLPEGLARGLVAVGSSFQLAVILAVVPLLGAGALRGLVVLVRRALRRRDVAPSAAAVPGAAPTVSSLREGASPPVATRREFLSQAAVSTAVAASVGTVSYGVFVGRHDYAIEELVVRIPGLSSKLDGYTIVQLSDVHIGMYVGEDELGTAIDLVRGARPDLVVLTGDLVDHDPHLAPALTELSARLGALARHGVAAVAGNHDHYAGVGAVLGAARRGGAHVLDNEARVIGDARAGFVLLGVDDVFGAQVGRGPNLARAELGAPPDLPRVLLCHNPSFFPEAAGRVALQLSGHTHGGQVNPGVRVADVLLPYGYVAGRYERGGSTLYVNRGFGTVGPPARVLARPEITRVILVAG
jgi:predicted MPP superfamily phosphohydrolase